MIKTAWFKAGATVENNTSHQGVVDMNTYIKKKGIQKQDIINVNYVISNGEAFYILMYYHNDSETVL